MTQYERDLTALMDVVAKGVLVNPSDYNNDKIQYLSLRLAEAQYKLSSVRIDIMEAFDQMNKS